MFERSIPLSVLTICLTASICRAGEPESGRQCRSVGGTVTTNFLSETTTLGTATGDLRGAVSATLLGQAPGANDTIRRCGCGRRPRSTRRIGRLSGQRGETLLPRTHFAYVTAPLA
jgi:hypothetical protein